MAATRRAATATRPPATVAPSLSARCSISVSSSSRRPSVFSPAPWPLVADAGHNLSDVLGLLMAWGATILATRSPSERFTYGFKSSSILAALFNAALLLVAIGAIALEAIQRLIMPEPVNGQTVIAVAAVGIVINTATALMFLSGRKHDINIRGAFLHMAADALVSPRPPCSSRACSSASPA